MKITCHACQSKYTVSDEKVQGKTVKIKCRKCGTTILVNSSGAATQNGAPGADAGAPAATTSGSAEAVSYLVNVNEGDQRTMGLADIVAAYNEGVIDGETYVWADGMSDWQPLSQIDAIVSALHSAAGTAAPEPEPEPAPAAPAAPPAEVSRPAAVRKDPNRRAHDLFGGGGDDVATSAPLFSASNFSSPKPAASPGPSAGTAQREENSVLFSLSALTAKASAPSGPSRTTAKNDDSGIIDLKALADAGSASSAPASAVTVAAALPDAGLFNLPAAMPAPPPMAAPPIVLPDQPPPKNRTGLVLGLGGLAAVVAIAGAFMFMNKGGDDGPAAGGTPAATVAAPEPTPEPTPEPVEAAPSAEASAAPSAEPTASATAKVASAPRYTGRPAKSTAKPSSDDGAAAKPAAAPAAPKAPPKSKCGCAPGDLMCAMKCSTK